MEGNGFTGFNPAVAKSNIVAFAQESSEVVGDFEDAHYAFFETLADFWASPKAVEFYEAYNTKILDLIDNMSAQFKAIVSGSVKAFNYASSANGHSGTIDAGSIDVYSPVGDNLPALLDQKNGNVGMNISAIEENILPNYKIEINRIITSISSLPKAIALYDDENGQQHAYQTHIDTVSDNVSSLISEMEKGLEQAIATETNNILLAKQQSTDTLTA